MTVQRATADKSNRTVEVAFSNDEPVEDFPGVSFVLSHDDGAVDLERLRAGAPVLVNHDRNDHVGVVDSARVDEDRTARAVLRFGESERAQEIFNDVLTGIRTGISVRGRFLSEPELISGERDGDPVIFRVAAWEPEEITIASVPASTSVGVGRARNTTGDSPKVNTDNVADNNEAAIQRALQGQSEAVAEVLAIGKKSDWIERAQELITTGKTSSDDILEFKREAGDRMLKAAEDQLNKAEKENPVTNLGLSNKEVQRYSVSRALMALLEGSWKNAEFERECSSEISKLLDKEPQGVFVPHDIQIRRTRNQAQLAQAADAHSLERAMTTGGSTTGAEYVGTRHSPENFIEQLRDNVVAIRAGARLLTGMRQNVDIPRKDGGATFGWLAEEGTVTLSDLATGKINLSPKTIGGGVQASRRMLLQSLPAIDDLIMQDLGEGAAETIDLGALEGSGASNQPTGITNASGVNTQIVNPNNAPTWDEVLGFPGALGEDNALKGSLAWVVATAWITHCMGTEKSTGSGRFIMEAEAASMFGPRGTLAGYPVFETNAPATGVAIFGNWSELLIAMWGVLDLMPDPFGAADQGALIIRAFQDVDIGVRHGVSFCVNTLT